jgi:very-short-patch-repair endonuclease
MDIDRVIGAIAERYLGLVPVAAMRRAGIDRHARQRRARSGQLEVWSPRVWRVAGTEPTLEQRVRAGTLDVAGGAVGSFVTASWVWRLPSFSIREVEVTAVRTEHLTSGLAFVHRPVRLLPHHVTEWRGIPVTSVPRTIWDLSGVIHPLRLARLIDAVCTQSPAVLAQLHRMLHELGGRGVPGTVLMRELLSSRPVGIRAAPSGYQARFEELMAAAGIVGLRREVDVGGHSWIGRVDYRCEITGALLEIDSALHHTSPTDVAADEARDAAALAAGFAEVVRIDADDLYPRPDIVVEQVRALRSRYRNGTKVNRSGTENGVTGREAG